MEQSAHEVANWQYYFAIAVFLITYGFIISEKLNRAVIALFGAAIMIIFGVVDLHTAFTSHIQWETITLLIGMMILVHITSQSGVFEFVAIKAKHWRKTDSHFIITIPINCCRISIFGQCNDCFINRSCYIIHYTYFKSKSCALFDFRSAVFKYRRNSNINR